MRGAVPPRRGQPDSCGEQHTVDRCRQCGRLLQATAAAKGGVTDMHMLSCTLGPAAFAGCSTQLAAAKVLYIDACEGSDPGYTLAPALNAILQQTPQLRDFCVSGASATPRSRSLRTGPPPALASLHHLTRLDLVSTWVPHLNGVLDRIPGGQKRRLVTRCLQQSLPHLVCSPHMCRTGYSKSARQQPVTVAPSPGLLHAAH